MSLIEIHTRLSTTATLFMAALALWALWLRIRTKPLDGNWLGAAVIGELVLVAQMAIGFYLYADGSDASATSPSRT